MNRAIDREPSARTIALAGAVSLAVAMGVGRFAFTPLLPMMLRDGTIALHDGSWLATANYAGYLGGALLCMALPAAWASSTMIRIGLIGTVLFTAGMALPMPVLWPGLRFMAGIASAASFVYTSRWCMTHLASQRASHLGGVIFTGPGIGIVLSGIAASGVARCGGSAAIAWLVFAVIAGLLSLLVWSVARGPDVTIRALAGSADTAAAAEPGRSETAVFAAAYGLAGFGYIITATFLPVIAREAIPGSAWLDLFWPILGLAAAIGALLTTRLGAVRDAWRILAAMYVVQAVGVVLALFAPSVAGFVAGSILVGLPFNAISMFGMQQARQMRPLHAARFMGLLTALYGLGQIVGPPLASLCLAHAATHQQGFAWALGIASASLVLGALLYVGLAYVMPARKPIQATTGT